MRETCWLASVLLEPCTGKLVRTVLRGLGGRNPTRLPDNFGLALRRDAYQERGVTLRYKDTSAALTVLKRQEETAWLRDVSCVPLQQTLRHLDTAFTNFFESCRGGRTYGYPRFKQKHDRQSATFTRRAFRYTPPSTDGSGSGLPKLRLAKMQAPLDVRWSRIPPSMPSTVTVSRDGAGRYFASLLCEVEPEPLPPARSPDGAEKAVGVDLGLTDLIVTSDGWKSGNPKFLEKDLHRLRKAQRRLARCQIGSKRYEKQRRKVARIHARIREKRQDYLHKLSTRLIRENQTVCLETLNVRGLMKNRVLARAVSSASWSAFAEQLEYKARRYGRTVAKVGLFEPTSKRCSNCNHIVSKLPLEVRTWTCERCGATHDRDVNAARNILAAGQAVCAETGRLAAP